jgi:hypothetical protein
MSFLRHPEIFPSDGGANLAVNTPAHRLDEFPAGYSLAGCAPAEPAAASPTDHHFAGSSFRRTMSFHRTPSCGLTGCLSRGVHSTQALKYYRFMQTLEDWDAAKYLGEPGFGTRELYQPLQAADFIARETFKFFYSGHEEPTRPVRIPIQRLKNTHRQQAIWWGQGHLRALNQYVGTQYNGSLNEFFARDLMRSRANQFLTKIRSEPGLMP